MDRLKGKVAIITGAAGGICHKASELFCQEGAKVVMVDIDPQVEQFSAEINANGGESIAVVADVAQRDTWVQLKKLADAKYGRIDTVVNGAAAFGAGLGAGVAAPCAVRRATFPGGRFPSGGVGLCLSGLSTMRPGHDSA